ncbi:Rho GTPase-activating protein 68F [Gryllus bimaculatus]|nr:Rho GTPase-activating protein 68F [Gryllus bimaculatus]
MSDNDVIHNDTPTESDKMDISEVSDQATPFSDRSPSEVIDNQEPDANAVVLDNAPAVAAAAAVTTNITSTTTDMSTPLTTDKLLQEKMLRATNVTSNLTTSKPIGVTSTTMANDKDSLSGKEQDLGNWSSAGEDTTLSREHSESKLSLEGLDLELPTLEMYQEEFVDFPSSPTHENFQPQLLVGERDSGNAERPGSLISSQRGGRRRIRVTADILSGHAREDEDDDPEDGDASSIGGHSSRLSDADLLSPGEDDADLDALLSPGVDTPDELEDSILERLGEPPPMTTPAAAPIPELTAAEERVESRNWRSCVIEPYKRVLSHGGYLTAGSHNAIIVFSACFLPDRSRVDYDYVMDNLFLYVLTTLDQLITEDYVLIYLHGATQRSCMPTFTWLKRCYQLIDRRLRKNLKGLYLVHPTFWLKTIVLMTKPFISSKFSRKLRFVDNLAELAAIVPLEQASIPDRVKQLDDELEERAVKRRSLLNWWWTQTPDTTTVSS